MWLEFNWSLTTHHFDCSNSESILFNDSLKMCAGDILLPGRVHVMLQNANGGGNVHHIYTQNENRETKYQEWWERVWTTNPSFTGLTSQRIEQTAKFAFIYLQIVCSRESPNQMWCNWTWNDGSPTWIAETLNCSRETRTSTSQRQTKTERDGESEGDGDGGRVVFASNNWAVPTVPIVTLQIRRWKRP